MLYGMRRGAPHTSGRGTSRRGAEGLRVRPVFWLPWLLWQCGGVGLLPAIQTGRVEIGNGGNYDGTVMIERDGDGRLVFSDNEVAAGVTLGELIPNAGFGNLVTVAEAGGDTDDLVDAYDRVTSGGVILVYPGTYVLGQALVLGEKSCSFVGLDPARTVVSVEEPNYNIVLGDPEDGTGAEDWDDTENYTPVGSFVFDGLKFDAGENTVFRIKRADMRSGGLTIRRCEFRALAGIETSADDVEGYTTGMSVVVSECVFHPIGNDYLETGILLANRSREGESPGDIRIERNVFNPAAFGGESGGGGAGLYYRAIETGGSGSSVLIEGNVMLNCLNGLHVNTSNEEGLARILSNSLVFDGDSSESLFPSVVGMYLAGNSDNEYFLADNTIDISDANGSAAVTAGYYFRFTSAGGNVIRSRNNRLSADGAAAAEYAEWPSTQAYTLEVTEDIWESEAISTGTFVIGTGGDRRSLEARVEGNLGLGAETFQSGSTHVLGIADGTAPTTGDAGMVQLFADSVSGTLELRVTDGAGNTTTLSPHNFSLFEPSAEHPFPFSYYSRNAYLGLEINVDMIGAIAELEKLSGRKFIYTRELPEEEKAIWRPEGKSTNGGSDAEPPEWLKSRMPPRRRPQLAE